jgi:hypothetical protein
MQLSRSICGLRIAVGYLGEKNQGGWWDSSFLNTTGFRYLALIFPKTTASAALTAASEAACKAHDERIGRGRVTHLFRLDEQRDAKIRAEITILNVGEIESLCSSEAALHFLAEFAGDATLLKGAGPIQIGTVDDFDNSISLRRLAATYAEGFRTGTRVFPYFA